MVFNTTSHTITYCSQTLIYYSQAITYMSQTLTIFSQTKAKSGQPHGRIIDIYADPFNIFPYIAKSRSFFIPPYIADFYPFNIFDHIANFISNFYSAYIAILYLLIMFNYIVKRVVIFYTPFYIQTFGAISIFAPFVLVLSILYILLLLLRGTFASPRCFMVWWGLA